MNPLSPTEIKQKIAEAHQLNARMQGGSSKAKMPKVATVLRKVVQGYLEAGEIDPAVPFTREDMMELLELEQREAQLPIETFRIYYSAVVNYPLGSLWIYLNWNKRPNPTKLGNFFRTIELGYDCPYMCHELVSRESCSLTELAAKEVKGFLQKNHPSRFTLAGYINTMYFGITGKSMEETLEHSNHFYHNWELFSKNPAALFYKVGAN